MKFHLFFYKSYHSKEKDEKFSKEEIFYEGKKDFNLKIEENQEKINSESIHLIFLNSNITYNVCYRCVDKINNKVYLYKSPFSILVKKP